MKLALAALAILYALSSGPFLSFHCNFDSPATVRLCECYLPLFEVVPQSAARYAVWCGAHELPLYILLKPRNTSQHSSGKAGHLSQSVEQTLPPHTASADRAEGACRYSWPASGSVNNSVYFEYINLRLRACPVISSRMSSSTSLATRSFAAG
jgi:hypothetical protein